MPIGLDSIGWKMYMINGSWDVIIIILIVSFCSMIACIAADFFNL
jgi:hypothetical protein